MTLTKRNTAVLTFAGVVPAYPDLDTFLDHQFDGLPSLAFTITSGLEAAFDYEVLAKYFDRSHFMASKVIAASGPAFLYPQAIFTAGKLAIVEAGTQSGDFRYRYVTFDAPLDAETALTTFAATHDVTLTPASELDGFLTRALQTGWHAGGQFALQTNEYDPGDPTLRRYKCQAMVFDGSAVSIYNAFEPSWSDPGINNGPQLLGDKYCAADHTSLVFAHDAAGATSLYRVKWTPQTFSDGFGGGFSSDFAAVAFDDATFNTITAAQGWYGIDCGNTKPYVLFSQNGGAANYIVVIDQNLVWYDVYTLATSDGTAATILADYTAWNYDFNMLYDAAGKIVLECNPASTYNMAVADIALETQDPCGGAATPLRRQMTKVYVL